MPPSDDLALRRKWTLRAHEQQSVFVKKPMESAEHVLMKAFFWALALPAYDRVLVERPTGDRYKPDVIGLDSEANIRFWGEAGHTDPRKMRWLARRYPETRLVFGRWNDSLKRYAPLVRRAVRGVRRKSTVEVWNFPADAPARFIADGRIEIRESDLEIVVIGDSD